MGTEKEKSSDISGNAEVREMGIGDLKDVDRVVWRTDSSEFGGLDVGADGGFIQRLEKVLKKYQEEVKLAVVGGTIIAVVLVSEQLKRRRK